MKTLFLIMMGLLCYLGTAQGGDQDSWTKMPDFAAKSPEAAAFQKYGDYQINLPKGQPEINIPLYTLDAGDYKLPITLSYQPGGIKVGQDATWVGLGWSLSNGAQIILDVRDTPDENVLEQMPDQAAVNDYLTNAAPWAYCDSYMTTLRTNSWIKDVYHFSSPTASGKFIIGDAGGGDVKIYPPDAFKVEYAGGIHTRTFKITDTQGNVYFFNNTREISNQVGVQGSQDYISAWYVDQIKTPLNNVINFNYTNDGYHAKLNVNDQIAVSHTESNCVNNPNYPSGPTTMGQSQAHNNIMTTKTYKVSSIEYNDFRIFFEAATGRLDLASPSMLAQSQYPNLNVAPSYLRFVQLQKKVNGTYTFVKGYEFQYSYFDAGGSGAEYYRKRLKLNAVKDMLDDSVSHTFTYSGVNLPPKDSRKIDAYGYFNNASNTTLVPKQYTSVNNGNVTLGAANRLVNSAYTGACNLTEITYPTKGRTKFIYEPNQFWGIDELGRYNEITVSGGAGGTGTPGGSPVESPGIDNIPICNAPNPQNCVVYSEIPYTVAVTAAAYMNYQVAYSGEAILTQNKWQYARVRIFSAGNPEPIFDSGKIKQDWEVANQAVTLNGSGTVLIEAYGQYINTNFQLKYLSNDTTFKNVTGPGLRIKEIEGYTAGSSIATKKRFTYSIPGEGVKSSGKLVFDAVKKYDPENFRKFYAVNCIYSSGGMSTGAWQIDYATVYRGQSPYFVMNEVFYTDIKEETIDVFTNATNGYTLYNYDFHPYAGSQDGSINIEYDWLRGNLLSKKVYKPGDKIVYQENNTYIDDFSRTSVIAGFKLYCRDNFQTCPSQENQAPLGITYENMGYNYTIPWHYLKSSQVIETLYNANNAVNGTVASTTTFNYNNPVHMQLSSVVKTSSLGETVETKYFYPVDSEMASEPCISDLINKNMMVALNVQSYRSGIKQGEKKTVYKNWGNNLILPELEQGAKASNALETRVQYISRDNTNGNVLEVTQPGGTNTSYIWGYNGVYPIAKIENITFANLLSGLGTTANALRSLTEAPANIRTLFPYSLITTYTYEPLKGVSSITSPNGMKSIYAYDGLGRLVRVTDADNNILSENFYNYKP